MRPRHLHDLAITTLGMISLLGCVSDTAAMFANTDTEGTGSFTGSETSGCPESLPASTTTCGNQAVEAGEMCFPAPPQTFAAPGYRLPRRNLLVGDFNGDTVKDLFVAGQVHQGTMSGSALAYVGPPVPVAGSDTLVDLDIGDLDFDGMTDVVTLHRHVNPYDEPGQFADLHEMQILWGNALLETTNVLTTDLGLYPYNVTVFDLEHDGMDELAISSQDSDVNNCAVDIMLPTPGGLEPFELLGRLPVTFSHDCRFTIGRVDHDALADLVPSTDPFVYLAVAAESDPVEVSPSMSRPPIATAQYGLDLDCAAPLGATHHDSEELYVWLQDPPLEFSRSEVQISATNIRSHAIGDLNHDGDQDLVVCAESGVDVHLGATGATFAVGIDISSDDCTDVLINDLDGDGGSDLVYLTADDSIKIFFNDI